jgi:hypothetical protein
MDVNFADSMIAMKAVSRGLRREADAYRCVYPKLILQGQVLKARIYSLPVSGLSLMTPSRGRSGECVGSIKE